MRSRLLYSDLARTCPEMTSELDTICSEALSVWKEQYLREYTAHGKPHIDQVELNLDKLTRPLQQGKQPLSSEEIFVLLAACYLHDIGMQIDDPYAREKHAQCAYDLILHSYAGIGGDERRITLTIHDRNARRAIAEVARAHWTTYALRLRPLDYLFGNKKGRLRLLGALLAMADLLDLSPVRASYYRTVHRLYEPKPISELHQTKHALVRGCEIVNPDPSIPGDLQFQLEWDDNSGVVQDISSWVLDWTTSVWRRLQPLLHSDSGGAIRWVMPWARARFNSPLGPIPSLSEEALHELRAQRAEQRRIDRDDFVQKFKAALKPGESVLFVLPRDSNKDGKALSAWCEAHAGTQDNSRVARLDVQPSATFDLSSLVSELMKQWGVHLHECDDDEALNRLRSLLLGDPAGLHVIIVVTEDYNARLLQPLLDTFFERDKEDLESSRTCVLLTTRVDELKTIPSVKTYHIDLSAISGNDIKTHLQERLGYSEDDSERLFSDMESLELLTRPAMVYTFIERSNETWVYEFS